MGHRIQKILFFSFPFRRTWLLLPFDLLAVIFATGFSFELRFSWTIPHTYIPSLTALLLMEPIIYVVLFLILGMYTRVWRYASVKDAQAIMWAATFSAMIVKLIAIFLPRLALPNSVWLSSWLLTLVMVAGVRLVFKIYGMGVRKRVSHDGHPERLRILIYGAGAAGAVVAREAERDYDSGWDIVGFVDDDKHKQGLMLNGHRILGTRRDLARVLTTQQVDRVLIAIPSMSRVDLRKLVDELNGYKVPILIIPPFTRWAVQSLFAQVRPVDVEDLLGRDPLPTDISVIGAYLEDAVVLVTGAGGSIGSEVCRQVALMNPKQLVLLGRGENSVFEIHRELKDKFPDLPITFHIGDVRDYRKMSNVFTEVKPNVVFHAAAHKHVPLMEAHPDEAFQNNIVGTRLLTELSDIHGVDRFILISSDKAVRPTNVMGASKRVAEMALQQAALRATHTTYVAVRFGNVLGSRGSVVRVFRDQIAKGGPVTITDERMIRYFMTIPEAVRLVIEAGSKGENGHIYLLDMGEPVRIMDLAERMIRLSGFTPGVDIPIEISGIRPGEKLFEELSREGDSVSIDPNERIWSVRCPIMSKSAFEEQFEQLYDLYESGDQEELGTLIKQLAWWEPAALEVAAASETDSTFSLRPEFVIQT